MGRYSLSWICLGGSLVYLVSGVFWLIDFLFNCAVIGWSTGLLGVLARPDEGGKELITVYR